MSRSLVIKFIAFITAACSIVIGALSLAGVALMVYQDLYANSLTNLMQDRLWQRGYAIAYHCLNQHAARQLGGCPDSVLEELSAVYTGAVRQEELWSGTVMDGEAALAQFGQGSKGGVRTEYTLSVSYPTAVRGEGLPPDSTEQDWISSTTMTVWENGERVNYTLYYRDSPTYTVVLRLAPALLDGTDWELTEKIYPLRYWMVVVMAGSFLTFSICLVYLCWAAGRGARDGEPRPGGLNRLPLDLYALSVTVGCLLLGVLWFRIAQWALDDGVNWGGLIPLALIGGAGAVMILGFVFALSAQLKLRKGYWWRNSVMGRCLRSVGRLLRRLLRWTLRLVALLPVIWQWLLAAFVLAAVTAVSFWLTVGVDRSFLILFLLSLAGCVGLVCYGGSAFGILLTGVRRMNEGNLSRKIPTRYLVGSFREFARQLNTLSESAMVAAQKQLKSERMKTELITNVSHDIKTPLTSIVNYVDLLQKPHNPQETEQYLEVLSRQSLRLKKLIDDLMEMSKAATGNLTVETVEMDAVEAINQALGEFSGKLADARLTPVYTPPEEPLRMMADGRLVWRVLSNLLGNAVKYALPGTRLYIDTAGVGEQVMISLKNISREPLNISSEELMERFVRGDVSRNTEGSGLGLNIAKSLMEVQKGQLQLLVDGDLFKVTLFFPAP